MKFTISKEYTTLAQLPKVKDDIKEFKARYTERDLASYFLSVVDVDNAPFCEEIISCNVNAFPAGYSYNDETAFSVYIIMHGFRSFHEIHFYCDIDLNIRTDTLIDGTKMYSCDSYVLK